MPRPIERLSEAVTVLYGLSVFCVMSSCCGRMGYMLFGADIRIGIAVMCALCAAVLFTGTDGAINFNAVLGAVITIGTIACCIYLLAYREHQTFSNNTKMTMSALSYSGYNLLTAGAVLVPMSKRIKNKTDAYLTGAVSACIMGNFKYILRQNQSRRNPDAHNGNAPEHGRYSYLRITAVCGGAVNGGVERHKHGQYNRYIHRAHTGVHYNNFMRIMLRNDRLFRLD